MEGSGSSSQVVTQAMAFEEPTPEEPHSTKLAVSLMNLPALTLA